MRRAAKVDQSQAPIIAALRANGMSVKDCSAVGQGFPDLCVGFRGITCLLVTKCDTSFSHRVAVRLAAALRVFPAAWAGDIGIVSTPDEAVAWVLKMAAREGRL